MTYYDTQQQNPLHNTQFNPQQWAAFNPQAAQPYGAWSSAPLMQAFGGYGLGGYGLGQAAPGQQYGQYGGPPPLRAFGYNPGVGAPTQGRGPPPQTPPGPTDHPHQGRP